MSRITLSIASVLAIVCAAPAFADVMDLQPITPIRRVEPVVLGYITAVGTHTVNVDVPRSEAMRFEFDSRTVMPRDLQTGTPVRIDFRLLDNGTHFANRVTPILPGSNDWRAIEQLRVSQSMTPEPATPVVVAESVSQEPVAVAIADPAPVPASTHASDMTTTSARDANADASSNRNVLVSENADRSDRLPQTASELPLLLTLGSASLAAAIALSIRRRRA